MDEINEQTENMKQIQEALSTPIGAAADIDEVLSVFCIVVFCIQVLATHGCLGDLSNCKLGSFWNTILTDLEFLQDELEAELEELEGAELEEQLLQPTTTPHMKLPPVQNYSPPAQVPVQRAPPQRNAEDDELAALQAEMAL